MNEKTYNTTNIVLAATLIEGCRVIEDDVMVEYGPIEMKGFRPANNVQSNFRRMDDMCEFEFVDDLEREKITTAYAGKRALVEPCGFQNSIRNLKQSVKEYFKNSR